MQTIRPLLEERREAMRRSDFEILGRMARAETPHGVMQFPYTSGPVLAWMVERDRQGNVVMLSKTKILIVSGWNGLPDLRVNTEEPCTACLRDCDVCQGRGKKLCEGYGCGGSGFGPGKLTLCPGPDCLAESGHVKPGCTTCAGNGQINKHAQCEICKGERIEGVQGTVMICSMCKGKLKYPTGIQGGQTNYRLPSCDQCHGTKFAGDDVRQDVAKFVNAQIGLSLVLGPITRFAVESVGGEGTPPQVFDVNADAHGDLLVLLLEETQTGVTPFLLGGVLNPRG
jgi:hypothetical protein